MPNGERLPIATVTGVEYEYPQNYGLSECSTHDATMEPYCENTDADGNFDPFNNPTWCSSNWCYVDRDNCNVETILSDYFRPTLLYYSFAACQSTNQFNEFYAMVQPRTPPVLPPSAPPSPPSPPTPPPSPPPLPPCGWWCNHWTCMLPSCDECVLDIGHERPRCVFNDGEHCDGFCTYELCGTSHCNGCPYCKVEKYCADWCNKYTCKHSYCNCDFCED